MANKIEDPHDLWAAMFDVPVAPWNDLSAAAHWRGTVWRTREAWLAHHGGLRHIHPLFMLPGVSILMLMADVLHIVDLGITHYVVGNVVFHVCYSGGYFLEGTPQAKLDRLWESIVRHYIGNETPSQLQNLTLAMICDPSAPHAHQPCLSSRVKAAESRHLVPILAATT